MNILSKVKSYMGESRPLFTLSLLSSALYGLVSLAPFVLIWFVVRSVLTHNTVEGSVYGYAFWVMGLTILSILLYFLALMLSHLSAFRVETNLRREAMAKVIRLPLGLLDSKLTGKMRKIIDEDSSATHTFIAHILPDLVASIMAPIGLLIMMFVFDWRFALISLVPLFIAFSIMGTMMNSSANNYQVQYLNAQEVMASEAVEYVRGIPVVKVFQQTVYSFKRFYDSILNYKKLVLHFTMLWQRPFTLYLVAINSFVFFLIPLSILFINQGEPIAMLISDLFLYILITPLFASQIMKVMYLQNNLNLLKQSFERIEKVTEGEVLEVLGEARGTDKADISFENVSFRYEGAKENALTNVNLTIREGETQALVGTSGGGKTTLARLVPRFWDCTEGVVKIGGVDVRQMKKEDLMNKVSFVFQNTKLFKISLRDNILYGKPNATEEELNRAIDLSQSREIIERLPNGLETKIGIEGTYLSGGEMQRIALARAFLKDAPIIVLDEATAFADPENEALIQQALRELMKGKTVLMIAHRLTTVQGLDRIAVLNKGQIIEQGSHDELLAKGQVYSSMWAEYQKSIEWHI